MTPLADRLRPKTLKSYIGQKHLLSEDKLLYKAIKNNQLFSMIFWGPPGVGKTTLARIIANEIDADFLEFSAVTTGIAELKKIFEELTNPQIKLDQKQTVIFIDEIHRFNKAQQDAFLPYVENGTITLIGATTENPSFEVIGPLLSRTRVLVLNPLSEEELKEMVNVALKNKENGLGNLKASIKKDALDLLIELSGGDGRILLNTLELAANNVILASPESNDVDSGVTTFSKVTKRVITIKDIKEAFQKKTLLYDKGAEEHYNTISAFIKSMRGSNVDGALYYLGRMLESGEDPLFIARRMVIFASEDIGMAAPTALVVANEVFRACETIGLPECQINLAHGVTYLASAKKDRSSYNAYQKALADVRSFGNLAIPLHLRNAPTKLMKELGYAKDYTWSENYVGPAKNLSYLPDKLNSQRYYLKKDENKNN